jgi:hypothetical protein
MQDASDSAWDPFWWLSGLTALNPAEHDRPSTEHFPDRNDEACDLYDHRVRGAAVALRQLMFWIEDLTSSIHR